MSVSVVFNHLHESIKNNLAMSYQSEEDAIKKRLNATREAGKFNPCEYGQDKKLVDCPLKRSTEIFEELNKAVAPFEIVDILLRTHKQITEDIKEFAVSKKVGKVEINGDIIISSLMTISVHCNLHSPVKNSIYVQYFSYLDYNIGSLGNSSLYVIAYIVTNFVVVVENMRQLEHGLKEVKTEAESPKIIQMDKVIVEDFFRAKRRALRQCCTGKKMSSLTLNVGLSQDSRESEFSDKETEESHCCTSRSLKSARLSCV